MQKTIIITLLLSLAFSVSSQIQFSPKNVLSPNAASLGEYGVIPVSPYTGLQNISIPIHEIEVGEHKIPITLNYHSGGVRIEQLPSWVGMNWSLNAGGCISRVVNSEVDEACKIVMGDTIKRGYYYHNKLFYIGSTDSTILHNRIKDVAGDINGFDVAPDKFNFNFLDYNGVFYMDHNGAWKVQCDKPIRVEFGGTPNDFTRKYSETSTYFSLEGTDATRMGRTHHFKKFTLIGEDGTKYIFGDNDDAIEYSVDLFSQRTDQLRATTWYLTKIIYPNNREIRFLYEHGPYIAQLYLNDFYKNSKAEGDGYGYETSGITPKELYSGSLIMPCYLMNIVYDYGHLYFEKSDVHDLQYENFVLLCNSYANSSELVDKSLFMPILANNGAYTAINRDFPSCLDALKRKKLDRIHVVVTDTAYKTNTIKYIDFGYIENTSQRLTLDSLKIGAESGSANEARYYFEYNQPELLPGYLSNKTDHWGFGNNIVSPRVNQEGYESTREPDISVSQYGLLTKITYPTGGYNRFEYEPHDYQQKVTEARTGVEELDSKKYAGGVRIKKIINSPSGLASDEYIDKEYFYVTDFLTNGVSSTHSSGILTQLYKYCYLGKKLPLANYSGGYVTLDTYGSMSYLPSIGNLSSNHIEYSEVAERNYDGSFTIYEYTNFGDGHVDDGTIATLFNQPTIYEPKCARDQERGLLKKKTEYTANGLKDNQCQYEYEMSNSKWNSHVEIFRTSLGTINGKHYYEGSAYYAYTYSMRPKTQIEITYEGGDSLKKETSFTYNNIGLVETITTTQSDSNKQRVTLKYPNSFSGIHYETMVENNRISPVVEKVIETINGYSYTTEFKQNNKYESNPVKPSSTYYAYGNNTYRLVATYKYDQYYNIVESNPINAPTTSYLWGYKGLYPVAEIKGLSHNIVSEKLNNSNFTMSDTLDTTALNNLRASLTIGTMTTYYYNSFGKISKKIDPNGRCTTYHYDILGRLIAIKDENEKYIEVYNYNYAH